jgi:hypothetical protein
MKQATAFCQCAENVNLPIGGLEFSAEIICAEEKIDSSLQQIPARPPPAPISQA